MRYRHEMDLMLEEAHADRERLELLERAHLKDPDNDNIRAQLASLYIDMGRHRKALELLVGHRFRSRHGIWFLTRLYQHANLGLGRRALKMGNPDRALQYFRDSMQPLVTLGEDLSKFRGQTKSLYYIGLAEEARGHLKSAQRAFRKAASRHLAYLPDLQVYRAMALRKLHRKAAAERIIRQVERYLERGVGLGTLRPDYVHYMRSLIAEYRNDPVGASREMKKAKAAGWRPSRALHFSWKRGVS